MRRITIHSALAVLLLVAATGAAAQSIDVEPRSIDFGKMKQHQIENSTIVVTNRGAGLLVIGEVKADCGCTVPTLDRNSLAPGESTEIEVQFDSKTFEGKQYKNIQINSNDPSNPVVDVMIMADVHAALTVDPASRRLGFQRSLRGETVSRRAVITAADVDVLEVSIDRARKGKFQLDLIEALDGDPRKAALEVTIPADIPAGKHRDNIRITTNVPDHPYVDIEARAWVTDVLMTSPERIDYRFAKSLKHVVRVSPFQKGSTEFKITGAEIDLPEITVEVVEAVPNQETQVLLEGTPLAKDDPRAKAARGRMQGTLVIHTDLEQMPTIEIPVTYMIRM